MKDEWNAWIREDVRLNAAGEGKLSGYTFAVKDVFSVRGHISSAGNPDWLRTHGPAVKTAEAIEQLLSAGADMHGLTHTDELMYSLNGQNVHYGTPVNPKGADLLPGGSSSGSAVAAAAGLVNFALGTDTGGSVRVPSSYCGIYGFRPTHGAVSMEGVIPLAPSFDTTGWMAGDAATLRRVGEVLLQQEGAEGSASAVKPFAGLQAANDSGFARFIVPEDAWELAEPESRSWLEALLPLFGEEGALEPGIASEEGLDVWMRTFRILQGLEIWETHGRWIEEVQPEFEASIAERFAWTSTLSRSNSHPEFLLRQSIQARLRSWLGEDRVLLIPTTPGQPPHRLIQGAANEERRSRTMQLSCIAGLAGLPQLHIPVVTGLAPFGLSVIAGAGQDLRLLRWAEQWTERHASALHPAAASLRLQA